ncbi:HAD hydrolase-like protein [uncultured Roseobacter sp.]|uniref:HAD-IIA family hydrolase n=1 Tax=uncultured Roseobacter sp. TaxID=114847 RepID=UPI002627AB7C|nr:HAD hydrolase-like protein [uncultured Roseobacter sp.]
MMNLSVAEAFSAYENARARLPSCRPSRAPARNIRSLAEISDAFDVFLLDAFGVLNIGDEAIPGTPERVRDLQAAGKRVLVVSNAASVPRDTLLAKYRRLGYEFDATDVLTSRMATSANLGDAPEITWGVMGLPGVPMDDFGPIQWHLLQDDPDAYDRAGGFLLIGSGDWSDHRQNLLEASLNKWPRQVRVANPDIVAPREDGFSVEPGYFAHRIAQVTTTEPRFFGKPFMNIYDLVFAHLGPVDRSRVVMVGDSLHTDILGAKSAGIASVLIAGYGFLAGHDAGAAIAQSGIVPDFIAERP